MPTHKADPQKMILDHNGCQSTCFDVQTTGRLEQFPNGGRTPAIAHILDATHRSIRII